METMAIEKKKTMDLRIWVVGRFVTR